MGDDVKKNDEFEFVEIAKKTITTLGPAIKQALLYTLLGIGIGMLLLWWQHYLEEINYPHVFWRKFLEHLGVGFIVSAIAVFFYEWGAHVKETVDLSKELNQTIHSIQNRIEPIVTSAGEQALDRGITALIGKGVLPIPSNTQKIITDCSTLVKNISELQTPGVWSSDKYTEFISYLLDSVVQNSTSLKTLAVTGQGDQRVIVASTAAIMADQILSLQMQAMESGDSYDVISSLPTWKGEQLDAFHEETRKALKRGVNVRRIFNRLRYTESEEKLPLVEARRILEGHLANTIGWSGQTAGNGNYEVKVLGSGELKRSASFRLRERAHTAHFGIFTHRSQSICYSVAMADLSNMAVVKNPTVVAQEQKLFEEAWSVATNLSQPLIEEILTELKQQQEKEALSLCDEIRKHLIGEPGATDAKAGPSEAASGTRPKPSPAPVTGKPPGDLRG